jgi:hypothetical protein
LHRLSLPTPSSLPRAIGFFISLGEEFLFPARKVRVAGWQFARSFADIDSLGPLHRNVRFKGYSGQLQVVSLTHPSFQGPNVRHRRYCRAQGIKAEIKMLKDSLNRLEQGKKQRGKTRE